MYYTRALKLSSSGVLTLQGKLRTVACRLQRQQQTEDHQAVRCLRQKTGRRKAACLTRLNAYYSTSICNIVIQTLLGNLFLGLTGCFSQLMWLLCKPCKN